MTEQEIANQLKVLAERMKALGEAMKQHSNTEMQKHGAELAGAGEIAKQWVYAIECNFNLRSTND